MAFDITTLTNASVNAKAVETALSLCGIHGERYGRMAANSEGLDCVGLIERVAITIGAPVGIDPDWQDHGCDLAITEIPVGLAEPGDVLVFDLGVNAAFRRFQLGILISGATTDPDARFIGVPHSVAPLWLNTGPWQIGLVRAYKFDTAMSQPAEPIAEADMTVAGLADAYGAAKALVDAAEVRAEAIKTEIRSRGLSELVGRDFTVTVTEQIQGRADTTALKAYLGADYSRFEKTVVSNVVRVKAVATAALARAA